MTRIQLSVVLLGLLLPLVASCSQPRGTYQRATIQDHDGVPCFGVPDTRETRANAPLVTAIRVTEIGKGSLPVWSRLFLRPGATEPALPPGQCLLYGQSGTPAAAPVLQAGRRYEVVISGGTPGMPGSPGEAQKRVFNACFYRVEVADTGMMKSVISDCASAQSDGPPPVRQQAG